MSSVAVSAIEASREAEEEAIVIQMYAMRHHGDPLDLALWFATSQVPSSTFLFISVRIEAQRDGGMRIIRLVNGAPSTSTAALLAASERSRRTTLRSCLIVASIVCEISTLIFAV